jgi:hypothetical protein
MYVYNAKTSYKFRKLKPDKLVSSKRENTPQQSAGYTLTYMFVSGPRPLLNLDALSDIDIFFFGNEFPCNQTSYIADGKFDGSRDCGETFDNVMFFMRPGFQFRFLSCL